MKKMLYEILIRIIVYGAATACAFSLFFFLLYTHPPRNISSTDPSRLKLKYETLKLKTIDGISLDSWFIPNKASDKAVIALHGYPMDKGDILGMVSFLAQKNNLLLFDFRATGRSKGFFLTGGKNETKDLDAAVNFLKGLGFKKIAVYGFSLGAAVTLLSDNPYIEAKIADSPFDTLSGELDYTFMNLGFLRKPLLFMMNVWGQILLDFNMNSVSVSEKVRYSKIPVLIFHGEADKTVPFYNSLSIKKANPEVELINVKNADHGQARYFLGKEYEKRISAFLDKNLK